MLDAARDSRQKIKYLEVGISSEGEVILSGPYRGKGGHVWKRLRDGILRDAIISVVSLFGLLYFGVKTAQAFVPIGALVLALPVWGIVLALLEKEQITCEER